MVRKNANVDQDRGRSGYRSGYSCAAVVGRILREGCYSVQGVQKTEDKIVRQRFVGLSVLALFVSIGFWAANALSLPYDYCDKTITAGYSCGAASNCSTSGCNGLGVKCEVTTVKQGTCLPGGFVCFTVNT